MLSEFARSGWQRGGHADTVRGPTTVLTLLLSWNAQERKTRAQEVWRRAGTARSRELKATGSYPAAVGQPGTV